LICIILGLKTAVAFFCSWLYVFCWRNSATCRPGICTTVFLQLDAFLQWVHL
jgi:hypothetical protein